MLRSGGHSKLLFSLVSGKTATRGGGVFNIITGNSVSKNQKQWSKDFIWKLRLQALQEGCDIPL